MRDLIHHELKCRYFVRIDGILACINIKNQEFTVFARFDETANSPLIEIFSTSYDFGRRVLIP